MRRVLGRGVRIGLWGVAIGLPIAWGGSRLLSSFLFEVSPTDPWSYLVVVACVMGVVTAAAYAPAQRAASLQPLAVLKSD